MELCLALKRGKLRFERGNLLLERGSPPLCILRDTHRLRLV
jgi:hypothetical protein